MFQRTKPTVFIGRRRPANTPSSNTPASASSIRRVAYTRRIIVVGLRPFQASPIPTPIVLPGCERPDTPRGPRPDTDPTGPAAVSDSDRARRGDPASLPPAPGSQTRHARHAPEGWVPSHRCLDKYAW